MFNLYPHKAQYRPGEEVVLRLGRDFPQGNKIVVRISRGHEIVDTTEIAITGEEGSTFSIPIRIEAKEVWDCFGVDASLLDDSGNEIDKCSTAFDICPHWGYAPRYGFLSDFHPNEEGNKEDVEALCRYHVNVVQFYDWMYRHDQLVSSQDVFIDPMGRTLSFKVVKEKIKALKERGMAPIAYGAVYASLKDFHDRHEELGLYQRNGKPYQLIDRFFIMDISPDSEWNAHIIKEFKKVIDAGFEGIHLDQYGFPKWALRKRDGREEMVDLAKSYPLLVNRIKQELLPINAEVGLIFNNVSNYPIYEMSEVDQEALYIEVWEPIHHLYEIKQRIMKARELGKGKHCILAAYLPAFNPKRKIPHQEAETGALLTMATIFSNGGYHLLLGEEDKVLTAAYYPDYGVMSEAFRRKVKNYYDFIVRYGHFLYPFEMIDLSYELYGGENKDILFEGDVSFAPNGQPGTVWVQVKQLDRQLFIHLINLAGIDDDCWHREKRNPPHEQNEILCKIRVLPNVKSVHFMSPDQETTESVTLPYEWVEEDGEMACVFHIPYLRIWSVVHIQF